MRIYVLVSVVKHNVGAVTQRLIIAEPTFFNDPSGCTAVVGLLTNDKRVIVVGLASFSNVVIDIPRYYRQMRAILERYWDIEENQKLCPMTTSQPIRVSWKISPNTSRSFTEAGL